METRKVATRTSRTLYFVTILIISSIADNCHGRFHLNKEMKSHFKKTSGVGVNRNGNYVVLDNGIVQVTFAVPEGYLTAIRYGGLDNLLEIHNKESDRGYWDIASANQSDSRQKDETELIGTSFKIISHTDDQAEISFICRPSSSIQIRVDKRYVILRGNSGFYSYAIFEREKGWAAADVGQIRAVFKLRGDKFRYMAISDKIQRIMPTTQDRANGKTLAYKEAVRLTNPINPSLKGEVDDKYQYASEDKDNMVNGWISFDPPIGFWIITPSGEFRLGGPLKQSLTSHVGPTVLAMFHSTHYAGKDLVMRFKKKEPWKKVFGPYLVHLNSLPSKKEDPRTLWIGAKDQMLKEVEHWPYDFPQSTDFPKATQRGSVFGRLLVKDGSNKPIPGKSAWVGLALPGGVGSWQNEMKGYQFWKQTNGDGKFKIKNIRSGNYSIYAWVTGFLGDYKSACDVVILPGKKIDLGDLTYEPPRNGPTLWEIGIPDRTAAEFFVPDPFPTLANRLFLHDKENKYRQYGLWDRYTDLYPKHDLVYRVGVSDYRKDWFFAQVLRRTSGGYKPTTWKIIFPMKDIKHHSEYTLQIALAAASESELQVRINNPDLGAPPHFTTKMIGRDNAIARHGIHGLYRLYSINIESSSLRKGDNTIYLTQTRDANMFNGVMYDYVRLEGPASKDKENVS